MIVDTSAVVAVLLREPGFEAILEKILRNPSLSIGAPTAFETALVLTIRLNRDGQSLLNDFLLASNIAVVPFTHDHATCATEAFLRFGKGRHAASLNFGDCLTYATAKVAGQPLLFKGHDFTKTDLALA